MSKHVQLLPELVTAFEQRCREAARRLPSAFKVHHIVDSVLDQAADLPPGVREPLRAELMRRLR